MSLCFSHVDNYLCASHQTKLVHNYVNRTMNRNNEMENTGIYHYTAVSLPMRAFLLEKKNYIIQIRFALFLFYQEE